MNNYITLDGKKYRTPSKYWTPVEDKPATVKMTLNGTVDVTYGPHTFFEWRGQIEGPVTPDDTNWGTIEDLRTTCAKTTSVKFRDHYYPTHSEIDVHVLGPFQERSLSTMWDNASNRIYVTVRIVKQ